MAQAPAPPTTIQDVEMITICEPKHDVEIATILEIREQLRHIDKAIQTKEPRFIMRVFRAFPSTRRKINAMVLRTLASVLYPVGSNRDMMQSFLASKSGVTATTSDPKKPKELKFRPATKPPAAEIDVYIHLLILVHLLDENHLEVAEKCSDALMTKVVGQNRRTLDFIAAKCYFYHSRIAELSNQFAGIRGFLLARLRTATLRNDFEGQAVLINCLLRNYLHYSLYDQADKLVKKSIYPDNASNNEWARFLYYLGRIKAAKLEYSAAQQHLVQSLRKAPQHAAVGFRQTVQKLLIVVELLLGNIPERQIFRQSALRKSLLPYFQLTQAVRMGNLQKFGQVVQNFEKKFEQDNTYTLIIRLRHNVIKTAVRSIGLSYSRISPADIAKKLGLDSAEDAEFVVAKAIRDGVIEATINTEKGYMRSKESCDIYTTREPQLAFHQRIAFCLDLHDRSVKAMRYPQKAYGEKKETAEERLERELQDLEFAKGIADDENDGEF